jgi:hypothetical protein
MNGVQRSCLCALALLAGVEALGLHEGLFAGHSTHARVHSQPPAVFTFRLTDPRSGECALWTAVEQLARQARVRIGFEASRGCHPGRKSLEPGDAGVTFEDMPATEAVDRLLQLAPEFTWQELNGIIVIRPAGAWTDPANALNQVVGAFSLPVTHPHFAVHAALDAARPSLLMPHVDLEGNFPVLTQAPEGVAVQFAGGTLLEAMNTIISGFAGVWQVGYTRTAFHVVLHTFDLQAGSTIVTGRSPVAEIER